MPICPNCRFEANPDIQAWMVRRGGQSAQGPFTRSVIEERIQQGQVEASDEVSRPDGPWKTFDTHEDFRAWFCPGDARLERRIQSIQSRDRNQVRKSWRARRRTLAVVGICIGAIGVSIGAWHTRAFVAPPEWIDSVQSFVGDTWGRALSLLGRARSEDHAARALQAQETLPGQEVIARLGPPRDNAPARLHFVRGRAALLSAPGTPPDHAIQELEAAAAADPENLQILAALVEGWASTVTVHPERNEATVALVSRIVSLDEDAPATSMARAALALASGSFPDALAQADRCLAIDPTNLGCQALRGRALMGLNRWSEARLAWIGLTGRAPHIPSWGFALAASDVEDGRFRSARGRLEGLLASWPNEPDLLALSARIAWLTGDWKRARDDATRALAGRPTDLPTRLLAVRGALAEGTPDEALGLLDAALDDLTNQEERRTLHLLASHARRLAGDTAGAAEAARQALGDEPSWGPGALALALAQLQEGDTSSAEVTLKEAYADDLSPSDASNVHVALGRVYLDQSRPKAAVASFERAIEVDPYNAEARLGLAETYLVLSNGPRALQVLRDIAMMVLEQRESQPPFRLCPLPARDSTPLLEGLEALVQSDPSLEMPVASARGIVHLLSGDPDAAVLLLKEVLRKDRQDAAARAMLGRHAMAEERWLDADALLTPLLVNPECEALSAALLGSVRSAVGRHTDALLLLRRAVKLSDGTGTYHRLLAEALFRSGDTSTGLEQARRAWQLDPEDWKARRAVLLYGPEA
ncbi:MAG: tetratricopeptide repeat protein [Deltaproteobacteria bacterium]|nr:tetratricopeptide repeat protein [Deltaproteobacteria bacterium]